ncbi:MAG: PD-(D/E)XK nuclease family protein [Acidobacteriota bacterium]
MNGYSYSSISGFENCPRSFEYRYIKKIPEAFQSIEAFMGSTVHSVLEMVYRNRGIGLETDEAELPGIFRKVWDSTFSEKIRIIKNENNFLYYSDLGIELLKGYFVNTFIGDLSKTISLEQKFEIKLDNKTTFRGIIDRLSRTADGILRVTDFKTGSAAGPLANLQLPSYAIYIFETNNEKEIELCIEDLKQRETRTAKVKEDLVDNTRNQLLSKIKVIENTTDYKAVVGSLCRWCGYNEICPEYLKMKNVDPSDLKHCPDCGSPLAERKGKFGKFLGCTGFPECKYTFDLDDHGKKTEGEMICPECGSPLRKRKGKFGEFFGCSSYPQCTFTRKLK